MCVSCQTAELKMAAGHQSNSKQNCHWPSFQRPNAVLANKKRECSFCVLAIIENAAL